MATRRVRVRNNKTSRKTSKHPDTASLDAMIDEVADSIDQIEKCNKTIKKNLPLIQAIMEHNGDARVETDKSLAVIETPRSNSRTVVDPKKFREAVSEVDFLASITVAVGAAKKVLPERKVEQISDKIPGAKKDPVARVERK